MWFSAKQALHEFTKKQRSTEYWNAPDCPCQIWLCVPYVYCPILSNLGFPVLWALLLIWLILSCLDLRKFFYYNTHDSPKCNEDITDKTVITQACNQPCREVCLVSSRGMPHRGWLHPFWGKRHKAQFYLFIFCHYFQSSATFLVANSCFPLLLLPCKSEDFPFFWFLHNSHFRSKIWHMKCSHMILVNSIQGVQWKTLNPLLWGCMLCCLIYFFSWCVSVSSMTIVFTSPILQLS